MRTADVRQFVPDDACQLLVGQAIANAGRHRHCVALLVDATGKSVELRVVDDVDLRHRHTARHGEVLHDVIDTRVFPALQRTGSCGVAHHAGVGEVGNQEPDGHDAHHEGQCHEEGLACRHSVELQVRALIAIRHLMHVHECQEGIHHAENDAGEKEEQQQALHVVAHLLRMNTDVLHFKNSK